ncbi:hypothetical protein ACF1CY_000762 [Providencia rettgeri]
MRQISLSIDGVNLSLKTHREFAAHCRGVSTAIAAYRHLQWLDSKHFTRQLQGQSLLADVVRPDMLAVRAQLCDVIETAPLGHIKHQYRATPRQDIAFDMGVCMAASIYEDFLLVNHKEASHEQ